MDLTTAEENRAMFLIMRQRLLKRKKSALVAGPLIKKQIPFVKFILQSPLVGSKISLKRDKSLI